MNVGFQGTVNYGGQGRFTVELVSALADFCDRLTLYPTPHSVTEPAGLDWWHTVPSNVEIKHTRSLARSLLRDTAGFRGHDVIHINYGTLGSAAALNALAGTTPFVYTIHGSQDIKFSRRPLLNRVQHELFERKLLMPAVSRFGRAVTVSKYNVRRLSETADIGADYVYHGIDASRFDGAEESFDRSEWGFNPDSEIVLFVGRFYPSKGAGVLIDAFERVVAAYDGPVELALVGGGDRTETIQNKMCRKLGDTARILQDLGDETLLKLYKEARVSALPSVSETFGIAYLEAMAAGTPVVYAEAGSAPEVVGDAGLATKPRDPDELASAILKLLADESLYARLKRKGRARAEEFTWEAAAKEYVGIYNELV